MSTSAILVMAQALDASTFCIVLYINNVARKYSLKIFARINSILLQFNSSSSITKRILRVHASDLFPASGMLLEQINITSFASHNSILHDHDAFYLVNLMHFCTADLPLGVADAIALARLYNLKQLSRRHSLFSSLISHES